jgi:soluble lytic murein transglycosylase-like protein
MIPQNLIDLAKQIAPRHGLEPALVCAVIEQESGGDPWAIRFEHDFFIGYVLPVKMKNEISSTEAYARAFSWGVMQVMGQTAREAGFGFDDSNPTIKMSLAALCDPANGIEVGCTILARKIAAADRDIQKGLEFWNGGGNPNYAAEVLARLPAYQNLK